MFSLGWLLLVKIMCITVIYSRWDLYSY
jgi:hypothetical protein